jgi:predicted ATP-grasp superfamily ATP-dependent carboligase
MRITNSHDPATPKPGVLYVLGARSWLSWILPFLDFPDVDVDVCTWELGDDPPYELTAPHDGVMLLSHHKTVTRDAEYALGRPAVFAQSPAAARMAFDKRGMAAAARRVEGLAPLPELDPLGALEYLERHAGATIIAKIVHETEGRALRIMNSTTEINDFLRTRYSAEYLLQPYIFGHEYSVNLILDDGGASVYPPVYKGVNSLPFVHTSRRHRMFPAERFVHVDSDYLMRVACDYSREIGARGLVEVEFLDSPDKLFLVEINPRHAATLRMSATATGVNPFHTLALCALGHPVEDRHIPSHALSVEYPTPAYMPLATTARISELGDSHISSRVTITAQTIWALSSLSQDVLATLRSGTSALGSAERGHAP